MQDPTPNSSMHGSEKLFSTLDISSLVHHCCVLFHGWSKTCLDMKCREQIALVAPCARALSLHAASDYSAVHACIKQSPRHVCSSAARARACGSCIHVHVVQQLTNLLFWAAVAQCLHAKACSSETSRTCIALRARRLNRA